MSRTIMKIGNSLGITLPKSVLEELELVAGDSVVLNKLKDGKYVLKKEKTIEVNSNLGIDQEFMDNLSEFMTEYGESLDILADWKERS